MLNLVPGIGISTAKEILKHFDGKIYNLMKIFESNESNESNRKMVLNDIKINNRKISKKIVENINNYLLK
jgi:5'-3' exonuclease